MSGKVLEFHHGDRVSYMPLTEEQTKKISLIIDDFLRGYRAGELNTAEEKKEFGKKIFAIPESAELISVNLFEREDIEEVINKKGVTPEELFILLQIIAGHQNMAQGDLYKAENEVAANEFKKKLAPFFEEKRKIFAVKPDGQRRVEALNKIEREIVECYYVKFNQVFNGNPLSIAVKTATEEAYVAATLRNSYNKASLAVRVNAISPTFRSELINFFDTLD